MELLNNSRYEGRGVSTILNGVHPIDGDLVVLLVVLNFLELILLSGGLRVEGECCCKYEMLPIQ
jgi:hypothetical protein